MIEFAWEHLSEDDKKLLREPRGVYIERGGGKRGMFRKDFEREIDQVHDRVRSLGDEYRRSRGSPPIDRPFDDTAPG